MLDSDCESAGMRCWFFDDNPYLFGECVCKNNYFGPFCQFSLLFVFKILFKYSVRLISS